MRINVQDRLPACVPIQSRIVRGGDGRAYEFIRDLFISKDRRIVGVSGERRRAIAIPEESAEIFIADPVPFDFKCIRTSFDQNGVRVFEYWTQLPLPVVPALGDAVYPMYFPVRPEGRPSIYSPEYVRDFFCMDRDGSSLSPIYNGMTTGRFYDDRWTYLGCDYIDIDTGGMEFVNFHLYSTVQYFINGHHYARVERVYYSNDVMTEFPMLYPFYPFDEIRENTFVSNGKINMLYAPGLAYNVVFLGIDGSIVKVEPVPVGGSATPPDMPDYDKLVFLGWDRDTSNVTETFYTRPKYAFND